MSEALVFAHLPLKERSLGQGTQPMKKVYLLLEAVNLYGTLLDTQDLSTTRGGSHALLTLPQLVTDALMGKDAGRALPKGWHGKTVMAAASKGLYALEAEEGAQTPLTEEAAVNLLEGWLKSEQPDPRFFSDDAETAAFEDKDGRLNRSLKWQIASHMSWVVVAEADGGQGFEAIFTTLSDKKADKQYQSLTCDLPPLPEKGLSGAEKAASRPCPVDGVRPVSAYFWRPSDAEGKPRPTPMSLSVATRRCLGRGGRRKEFYKELLEPVKLAFAREQLDKVHFADDFEEIVKNPPKEVPEALRGKMAVLVMDANSMGKAILEKTTDEVEYQLFCNKVSQERANIAKALLEEAMTDPSLHVTPEEFKTGGFAKQKDGKSRNMANHDRLIRLETLMWGGDEMAFVLPAWGLEAAMKAICSALPDAEKQEEAKFTYAIGAVLCNFKTPIQEVMKLADDLSSEIKKAKEHVLAGGKKPESNTLLQVYTLGHIELPEADIDAERQKLYKLPKVGYKGRDFNPLQLSVFSLDGMRFREALAHIEKLKGISGQKDFGIPRARLVEFLQEMIKFGALGMSQKELEDSSEETLKKPIIDFAETLRSRGYHHEGEAFVKADKKIESVEAALVALAPEVLPALLNGDSKHPLAPLVHIVALWPYAGLCRSIGSNATRQQVVDGEAA